MRLNLGSGRRPQEGYVNVDMQTLCSPDVIFDLNQTPWPWDDNSVEEIHASHILEHLGQEPATFLKIMAEIYRILAPNATITIKVPHHRSDGYWGDPTHVRAITPQLLSLFSKKHCATCRENNWPNTPLAEYLNINLELETTNYNLLPRWGMRLRDNTITQTELDHAVETYNNVIDEVTMVVRKLE